MARDPASEARKSAIKAKLEPLLLHRDEIGLDDVKLTLAYQMPSEPWGQDGRFMAKMLNALGWWRDGWLGTGYDREPRYVPERIMLSATGAD